MSAFLLAHLSDPHLGPLPRPQLGELVNKRALGLINWQRNRRAVHRADVLERIVADLKAQQPDHIAVTGDLVNLSLTGEYPPARAWLEALGPASGVTLVPGNHDAYVRPVAQHPQLHWGDFMRGDNALASHTAEGSAFPFLRRRGPLALIGLSSAVPTGPLMATGRLGSAQLQRLAGLLDFARSEGLFRVVLIHHPPVSTRSHYLKRLVDGPQFLDVLARHGAELLIHGHNHEHCRTELTGPRGVIAAIGVPSASEAPPGEHAGYNLYRIEGAPGAWHFETISRGLSGDGESIVELKRTAVAAA
jgi:3',5'-cyclic AMP phosphodiesterase CpdA